MAIDIEGAKLKQRRQALALQQKIQLRIRQSFPTDEIGHGGVGLVGRQQLGHGQPSDSRLAPEQQTAQREVSIRGVESSGRCAQLPASFKYNDLANEGVQRPIPSSL